MAGHKIFHDATVYFTREYAHSLPKKLYDYRNVIKSTFKLDLVEEDDGQYSCYGHVKLLAAFIDDFPRYVKEEEKKAMDTMYKECSSSSYAPSLLSATDSTLTMYCPICEFTSGDTQVFRNHIKGCKTKLNEQIIKFLCNLCDQKHFETENLSVYIRHVKTIHSKRKEVLCEQCGVSFNRKDSLRSHKIALHGSGVKKPYTCEICNKSFRCNAHLITHYKKHDDSKCVQCNICDAKFKTEASKNKHIVYKHSNPKMYKCDQCNRSFSTKQNLQTHLAAHRRQQRELYDADSEVRAISQQIAAQIQAEFEKKRSAEMMEEGIDEGSEGEKQATSQQTNYTEQSINQASTIDIDNHISDVALPAQHDSSSSVISSPSVSTSTALTPSLLSDYSAQPTPALPKHYNTLPLAPANYTGPHSVSTPYTGPPSVATIYTAPPSVLSQYTAYNESQNREDNHADLDDIFPDEKQTCDHDELTEDDQEVDYLTQSNQEELDSVFAPDVSCIGSETHTPQISRPPSVGPASHPTDNITAQQLDELLQMAPTLGTPGVDSSPLHSNCSGSTYAGSTYDGSSTYVARSTQFSHPSNPPSVGSVHADVSHPSSQASGVHVSGHFTNCNIPHNVVDSHLPNPVTIKGIDGDIVTNNQLTNHVRDGDHTVHVMVDHMPGHAKVSNMENSSSLMSVSHHQEADGAAESHVSNNLMEEPSICVTSQPFHMGSYVQQQSVDHIRLSQAINTAHSQVQSYGTMPNNPSTNMYPNIRGTQEMYDNSRHTALPLVYGGNNSRNTENAYTNSESDGTRMYNIGNGNHSTVKSENLGIRSSHTLVAAELLPEVVFTDPTSRHGNRHVHSLHEDTRMTMQTPVNLPTSSSDMVLPLQHSVKYVTEQMDGDKNMSATSIASVSYNQQSAAYNLQYNTSHLSQSHLSEAMPRYTQTSNKECVVCDSGRPCLSPQTFASPPADMRQCESAELAEGLQSTLLSSFQPSTPQGQLPPTATPPQSAAFPSTLTVTASNGGVVTPDSLIIPESTTSELLTPIKNIQNHQSVVSDLTEAIIK